MHLPVPDALNGHSTTLVNMILSGLKNQLWENKLSSYIQYKPIIPTVNQQCPVRFLQGGKTGIGVMGGPIFLN
jgi:hypothetical protein